MQEFFGYISALDSDNDATGDNNSYRYNVANEDSNCNDEHKPSSSSTYEENKGALSTLHDLKVTKSLHNNNLNIILK